MPWICCKQTMICYCMPVSAYSLSFFYIKDMFLDARDMVSTISRQQIRAPCSNHLKAAAASIISLILIFVCVHRPEPAAARNAVPFRSWRSSGSWIGQTDVPAAASFVTPLPQAINYTGKYFSQNGVKQDEIVDKLLRGKTGGFFVESGAFDGVNLSNTLFLEATRGWKGLLVEANPVLYERIVRDSGRKAQVIHACVSPSKQAEMLLFRQAEALGGLVSEMSMNHQNRINREYATDAQDVVVKCWPMASMLKRLSVKRVDFWSLDTEGSEATILAATDFDAIDVRIISVEINDAAAEAEVREVMSRRPEYTVHSKIAWDLVFVKNGTI